MNFKEYIPLAVRTAKPLASKIENVGHAVLGMFTELSELQIALENRDEVNIGEECGDYLWYLALLAHSMEVNVQDHTFQKTHIFDHLSSRANLGTMELLADETSRCLDIVKKTVIYNKEVDKVEVANVIAFIFFAVLFILDDWELNESDVMQKNINKLSKRYPNLYTDYDADNRDLDAERKELEDGN